MNVLTNIKLFLLFRKQCLVILVTKISKLLFFHFLYFVYSDSNLLFLSYSFAIGFIMSGATWAVWQISRYVFPSFKSLRTRAIFSNLFRGISDNLQYYWIKKHYLNGNMLLISFNCILLHFVIGEKFRK